MNSFEKIIKKEGFIMSTIPGRLKRAAYDYAFYQKQIADGDIKDIKSCVQKVKKVWNYTICSVKILKTLVICLQMNGLL